ncbi:casparian strip membrane protein 1-like [Pyrus communis]|uniref:casparian strip membrane protein 1-like n=1 Tax=Pyrus communis TaxID=23211 RepID=UPI0035C0C09B
MLQSREIKWHSKREVPYVRVEAAQGSNIKNQKGGWKKGIAILDFILRLGATTAALCAAIAMGSIDETLPFFTQFFSFEHITHWICKCRFFAIAMGILRAYLLLFLPFSIVTIIRPHAAAPKLVLLILTPWRLLRNTSGSAAASAIVHLAHNGNSDTNWLAIFQQFGNFCRKTSGAVVLAFVAVVLSLLLILLLSLQLMLNC